MKLLEGDSRRSGFPTRAPTQTGWGGVWGSPDLRLRLAQEERRVGLAVEALRGCGVQKNSILGS
jgi:hypothetical protein